MSDNPKSNFDDAPVSGRGASFLELFERQYKAEKEEKNQEEQDLSVPLSEKIINKNWKIRKSALEEISYKVSNLSSFDPNLFNIFSQILTDSHQGNLEEAVNILKSYLEKNFPVPKENQNELNMIIKLLIEKCYSSSKQALKDKSKDMIISFVEYLNNTDILVDNIITLMQSKNQKMSQSAVSIITILLSLFGSNSFNYKKISSSMTTLSDKCSPLIKQNIVEFFIELYKWIKKLLKPLIEKKVKDIIKNDIEKGIEQINEQFGIAYFPQPTKFLGKKPKNMESGNGKNDINEDNGGDIEMSDDTEIDIFTKKFGFDEKFVERMLKPECKWKEKKEAFDNLTELINPEKFKRKIKNTNRLNFIDMVKRLLKEPNQNVRHSIIRCMGNMSVVLGNNFASEAKELFPRIIENFSINKLTITNDLIKTLINFSNIIDDNWINEAIIKYGTKSICNISKTNLIIFIEKLLDSKKGNSLNCYINTIKDIVIKFMDDHSQEIRNISTKLMVYIKNTKFNLYNNNLIKQALNEQKIKKIENFDNTERKIGNNKNIKNYKSNNNININENTNNTNTNNFIKKSTNISSSNSDLNIKKNQNKGGNQRPRNENKPKLTPSASADNIMLAPLEEINISDKDDVINIIKQYFGEDNINLFDSRKWQEKKEGFSNLNNYFINENNEESIKINYDYFLKFILIKNKLFKENNIIVLKESLICLNTLIEKLDSFFSKKYYNPLLKILVERIGERKIHQETTNIIENLIKKTSPKEIILSLMRNIRDKTVPILNGGALIINNLINPNNIDIKNNKIKEILDLYPIKDIIEFCCFLENNTNNQSRNAGTNILCSLYAYMGNNIKILLKDLKESTLKTIEEKFEKIKVINTNNSSNNSNILEQIFPRIDISKKITPNLIKDLTEGKWINKKEAITSIENIIKSSNNKIQPKGLSELFNCIKFNLKDSNKNIVKMIMKLIEELCIALGNSGFRQYQRQIIPGIISNFSDKNTQVKEESIKCIEKLISIMGFDSIGSYFPNHLNIDNYEIKNEILNIIIKNKNFISNKKEYIKEFSIPLINCLLDKNGIIRTKAEEIAQEIVKYFGISFFNDAIKSLKTPTALNQIKEILNKINDKNSYNKPKIDYHTNISEEFENNIINNDSSVNIINNIGNNIKKNIFNDKNNIRNIPNNFLNNNSEPINQSFILMNNNNIIHNSFQNDNNSLSNEISMIIKKMYSSDINGKYHLLINLQLLLENNENILNQKTIEEIFIAFNTLLSTLTKNIRTKQEDGLIQNIVENNKDIKLLKYLLDVYYFISNQYKLMTILNNEIIVYECYERLLMLISERTLISNQYATNLIQILNSIIMNFLNNCNVTISIISLIKIILDYKSNTDEYAQICTLAIKCLDKYRNLIFKLYNILDLNKIFECFYQFFSEFEKTNENLIPHNKNEDNALAMINSMIYEFIKVYGDKIWNIYQNSLTNEIKRIDIYLKRSIEINLRDFKNNNFLMNNNNFLIDNNFIINKNNNFNNIKNNIPSINKNNIIRIDRNRENNININNTEQNDVMNLVNTLKENGKKMNFEEKNYYYNKIVGLLRANNQPVTLISTKLNLEYYSKIYELYHSFNQQNSSKSKNKNNINTINLNNSLKVKLPLSNGQKNKIEQNEDNNNDFIVSEQARRIQEYKNKFNSLTEKLHSDNNRVVIFPNNNNNFNFKGNINDENKQINNNYESNDLSNLEKRKREIDELSKRNNTNSQSIFNSQSDIPLINTSFITNNIIGNNNINTNLDINNNDNGYLSQNSVKNMKICLEHIRKNIQNNVNSNNDN